MNRLDLGSLLSALGLQDAFNTPLATSQQAKDPSKLWANRRPAQIDRDFLVCVPLADPNAWEYMPAPEAHAYAAARAVNCVHFYRKLHSPSELPAVRERHVPKLIAFVGDHHRSDYLPALEPLKQAYSDATPPSLNASDLLTAIEAGVDALYLVAHGHSERGIVFRQDDGGTLTLAALEHALLNNQRPLRFAYFMLCDLCVPLLELLGRLAEEGKLHPQFGAVVMWGSPSVSFGQVFTRQLLATLLNTPDPQYPFLKAIQAGRLAVVDEVEQAEAARPIAVAFQPHANPLPHKLGQAIEEYVLTLSNPSRITAI